ncbi:glutathione S-transferase N-terminal domain-containing protein [bacterium]|nr:glutathione S-transferase N-terminal domain-containing protein [bacterium]
MIDLFISETCPYCKKVVDFADNNGIKFNKISISDDDNVLRLLTIGGKEQVPFLYNPSDDTKMYESDDIIEYLKNIYQV